MADSGRRGRATRLTDRLSERAALGQLLEALRAGDSRALVVRGDPGVGKTVLLDHLARQASGSGCWIARVRYQAGTLEKPCAGFPGPDQVVQRVDDILKQSSGSPILGDSELLAEAVPPLSGDVNAPVLVALQPAEIYESREQAAAQSAGKVGAVFGRVRVVPNWLAARGDHHAERLQEGPSPGSDQVPVLLGVRTCGLVGWFDVALLDEGTHQLDAEGAAEVVVTDSGLPPGPSLLALPQ